MILRCVHNEPGALPDSYLDPLARFSKQGKFPLTKDKKYVAYGIASRLDQIHYIICDDDYDSLLGRYYPRLWPAPLFEIVDSRASSYWMITYYPEHADYALLVSFEEWVEDRYYYDRLTDLDEEATRIFRQYKKLMDSETSQN
jgi:hypothetical protein